MAIFENMGILTYIDENGNKYILYPVTKAECIDGLEEAVAEKLKEVPDEVYIGDGDMPDGAVLQVVVEEDEDEDEETRDISLGIHSDGLLYVFVNGVPTGIGIDIATAGDIYAYVDEHNNIIVQGNLANSTYSVKYEMEDGSTVDIGDLVLDTNTYYSVTKTLTNCTISNSVTQVVEGGSYSATITANDGYTLDSVTATMGGSAVAVANGVISIASVTGDIVITAIAIEKTATTYTVTNNLTNCTNSNSATVVEEGAAYNATISPANGYTLDSVTVTMGGNAVTVSDGVINITSVTGNIVITAVAEEVVEEIVNWIANSQNADGTLLASTNNGLGYKADTRLGTSDGGERSQSGIECTGYIPVTINDTLYFKGVTITSSSSETLCFYDSSHQLISGGGSSTSTLLGTMDGSTTTIKLSDIKAGAPANNPDQIAYVRISANTIDANSIITKNQPIE